MANEKITMWVGSVAAVLVVGLIGAAAAAGPIPVVLDDRTFSELLPGTEIAAGLPLVTDMSQGNLKAEVASQGFKDEFDNYAYLYQVVNTGTMGVNPIIEVFTCNSFYGASEFSTIGYLTDGVPDDFALGDQLPIGVHVDASSGPTISFGYPGPWLPGDTSWAIDPEESSVTLFVLSNYGVGMIMGNVIDGEIGSGDIVGPLPEPTTISLLCLGAVLAARRRRRRPV